ncbi:hypothetical protein P4O66_010222 [Electrophorus voltai]|uniref:R-spondin Fu-CRD domain-containing protein n=1 Tax=Electrophorus voltai TaxID=2609070 RepID=A0AAD9DVU4_9TELE|nr:hypothetical protein P4O66_010222 [Electrophorus voltai]
MQLGLVALAAIFLSSMGHGDNLKVSRGRRQRQIHICLSRSLLSQTSFPHILLLMLIIFGLLLLSCVPYCVPTASTDGPASCSSGCESCSEYNGCTKCRPRLFILLERNDIRQTGVCLATCPVGYYGIRNRDVNRCTLQCELGEWSQWGPCMKKNKICGFKKGNQSRRRQPMQAPSPATVTGAASSTCAPETEIQRCSLPKRIPCGKGMMGQRATGHRGVTLEVMMAYVKRSNSETEHREKRVLQRTEEHQMAKAVAETPRRVAKGVARGKIPIAQQAPLDPLQQAPRLNLAAAAGGATDQEQRRAPPDDCRVSPFNRDSVKVLLKRNNAADY